MSIVKINNKNYAVPQLSFKDMVYMETMGFSVSEMLRKQQIFSLATAFVGVVTERDREEAEELCQQHVMGGGDINQIYASFMEAASTSDFFKKLLGIEEEETATKKTSSQKKE